MFIGHYSAAFLAKRVAPQVALPFYFVACQLVDFFWGVFVILGVEKVRIIPNFTASNPMDLYFMPYTHSLMAAGVWSLGAACIYFVLSPRSSQFMRNALVVGAVVGSHWLLDFVVHRRDLPLLFDGIKVGMGLWDYRYPALLLELGLLWIGVIASLKQAGENRQRYLILAIAMSVIQVFTLIMPLPTMDYLLALQLLASFSALTYGSYWADKTRAQRLPVSA